MMVVGSGGLCHLDSLTVTFDFMSDRYIDMVLLNLFGAKYMTYHLNRKGAFSTV